MTSTMERGKKNPAKAGRIPRSGKKTRADAASLAEKKALIDSLCGSLSWVGYSVDEYLREKREDVRRENGA